jgi:hypothetical protein
MFSLSRQREEHDREHGGILCLRVAVSETTFSHMFLKEMQDSQDL